MHKFLFSVFAGAILAPALILAAGNTTNDSFAHAKKILGQVYEGHRMTLYCGAQYDEQGNITLPEGFTTPKHEKRAQRIEWEHVVPDENFGRAFDEWREGSPECVDNRGKAFKGRKCAEKTSMDYRYMQADMYNLYPAIGAVNAMRSNFNFQMLPGEESSFGSCAMKIADRKVEPPALARGQIARTYFYMQDVYPLYRMSRQQEQLMGAWNKMYPVDEWECTRAKRIEAAQGNENKFVKEPCVEKRMW